MINNTFHYYDIVDSEHIRCNLCRHNCKLKNSQVGICGVNQNIDARLETLVYGHPIAIHVDPVEKKPLYHMLPNSKVLSFGTVGCNFRCPFCQNWDISQTNKIEAAQLLLLTSSTESKYAQFRLARSLYKGQLFQKNLDESFTLMQRLAMNDLYPEAICDLGQFYENGIGTPKDKKKAEELYKEAMDLGIYRAIEHYTRLQKEHKKLFSIFRR